MANAWLVHVKATMKKHPGKSFKLVLKEAKKTYTKVGSSSSKKTRKVRKSKKSPKSKKSKKSRKTRKTRGKK